MADEVLLEHEAPPLDDVQQGLLEGLGVHHEPNIKHHLVLRRRRRRNNNVHEEYVIITVQICNFKQGFSRQLSSPFTVS